MQQIDFYLQKLIGDRIKQYRINAGMSQRDLEDAWNTL